MASDGEQVERLQEKLQLAMVQRVKVRTLTLKLTLKLTRLLTLNADANADADPRTMLERARAEPVELESGGTSAEVTEFAPASRSGNAKVQRPGGDAAEQGIEM